MKTKQFCAAIVAGVGVIGFAVGCNATALAPNQNDALRSQIRDLGEKVKSLEAQRIELQQQIASMEKNAQDKSGADPDILTATPRLATVQIDGSSHFQFTEPAAGSTAGSDDAGSKRWCIARVYLEPADGLGRFLQIVGSVKISVFELRAGGQSQTLGHGEFSPLQVRDAWRGGLMGTHYTFEIPLAGEGWKGQGSVTVKLEFVDGTTGRTFTTQREITRQK